MEPNRLLMTVVIVSILGLVFANLPPDYWRIMNHRNFGPPGNFGPMQHRVSFNPHFRFPVGVFGPIHSPPNVAPLPPGADDLVPPGSIPPSPIQPPSINGPYKIVCYYESWAANRPDQGKFIPNDINPFMCSHIIYAHAALTEVTHTLVSADQQLDIVQGGYKNITDLKRHNPELKIMISVGGDLKGSSLKLSLMTRSPQLRNQFVESTIRFLKDYKFDGLDIDWRHPGSLKDAGRCEDKENLIKLVKELRLAFQPHGFLLSAALIPLKDIIDDGYDVPQLSMMLDFINVKAFDYRNQNNSQVDHHSPLGRRPHDKWENVFLNINFGIRYLTEKGAEPSKLILGIPFYGRSYTLMEPGQHDMGSVAKGPGLPGPVTQREGIIAYYEFCQGLLDGAWKVERDEYGKVPYAFTSDQWIGYDDETSIEAKMNFIKEKRLGGAMIWAIDLDDFHGLCGEKWPLTRKIYSMLCGNQGIGIDPKPLLNHATRDVSAMYPTMPYRPQIPYDLRRGPLYIQIKVPYAPIHTQPAMEVRAALYAGNHVCKSDGFHRDPVDCSKFYACSHGLLHQYVCPFGLQFNEVTLSCDWANYAQCRQDDDAGGGDGKGTSGVFVCPGNGIFADPDDCRRYYMCANGEPIQLQCSPGTVFSKRNKVCDWERNAKCTERGEGGSTSTTTTTTTTTEEEGGGGGGGGGGGEWEEEVSTTTTTRRPARTTTKTTTEEWISETTQTTERVTTTRGTTKRVPVRPSRTSTKRPEVEGPEEVQPPDLTDNFKVVCYFTNWAWYRPGDGKFMPEDVDTALCTHIIYAFTVLDNDRLELKPHDPWADIDNHFFERVVALKKINPKLKVLVGLGGWTDSLGPKYSRLVNNPSSRAKFIQSALDFINRYGFDGMDLDWEYPKCWQVDCKKGPDSDKQGFTAWVQELRDEFDKNDRKLLLTAAVSPSKKVIDLAYEVAAISKNFDFINVMTYDYHGSWEKQTGHVAPLYHFPGDVYEDFNGNFTINYWMQLGAPREKLIMGMPFYGQAWSLADTVKRGMKAPTYGPGEAGPFSRQGGMLGYNEICVKINRGGWTVVSDPQGRIGPFAFNGNQWVSFDDITTIKRKAQFVYDNRLGGAMLWALDFDDFRNTCCREKYPLLKTINRVLRNYPADTSPASGSCNYNVPADILADDKPIMTQIRKICITSRCTF